MYINYLVKLILIEIKMYWKYVTYIPTYLVLIIGQKTLVLKTFKTKLNKNTTSLWCTLQLHTQPRIKCKIEDDIYYYVAFSLGS